MWNEEFEPFTFIDEPGPSRRGKAQSIHIEAWEGYGQFAIDWTYDPTTNNYLRKNGGVTHVDRNTKEQLSAKNLVVLEMIESRANDGYEGNLHLLYRNKGTGRAHIFMNGQQTTGTWRKADRTSRTLLFDNKGQEIKFNRGKIWYQILPTDGVMDVS